MIADNELITSSWQDVTDNPTEHLTHGWTMGKSKKEVAKLQIVLLPMKMASPRTISLM